MDTALSSNRKSALSADSVVGVLLGGTSSERKISLRSGRAVLKAFERSGIRTLALDPANRPLFAKRLKQIDLAFLALHGTGGEDGQMQRYLEKAGVPYTGSDAASSLDAFDKVRAKKIFIREGIPTAPYVVAGKRDWESKLNRLGLPAFAKPIADGSSVGAFPIDSLKTAKKQILREVKQFGSLLIERKIEGREFTVGILGGKTLPVIEMIPGRRFFDYKAKYTPGVTRYDVPAKIPDLLARRLQKIALRAHKALKLRDLSRVDLMVHRSGRIDVLEANSIPGMTEMSLLPKAARAAGISFEAMCLKVAQMALKRKKNIRKR